MADLVLVLVLVASVPVILFLAWRLRTWAVRRPRRRPALPSWQDQAEYEPPSNVRRVD